MVSGAYATGGIVGYNLGVITGCTNVGAVNSEYQESALDMEASRPPCWSWSRRIWAMT